MDAWHQRVPLNKQSKWGNSCNNACVLPTVQASEYIDKWDWKNFQSHKHLLTSWALINYIPLLEHFMVMSLSCLSLWYSFTVLILNPEEKSLLKGHKVLSLHCLLSCDIPLLPPLCSFKIPQRCFESSQDWLYRWLIVQSFRFTQNFLNSKVFKDLLKSILILHWEVDHHRILQVILSSRECQKMQWWLWHLESSFNN